MRCIVNGWCLFCLYMFLYLLQVNNILVFFWTCVIVLCLGTCVSCWMFFCRPINHSFIHTIIHYLPNFTHIAGRNIDSACKQLVCKIWPVRSRGGVRPDRPADRPLGSYTDLSLLLSSPIGYFYSIVQFGLINRYNSVQV